MNHPIQLAVLTLVFAVIAGGLGYPTLKRYDPTVDDSLSDVQDYAELVSVSSEDQPEEEDEAELNHRRYRVLIPTLARPIRAFVDGRVGGWNETIFALLAVNALLVGLTAALLVGLARAIGAPPAAGVIGGLLLVSSFIVANYTLCGLVDSAEMLALTFSAIFLNKRRFELLPLLSVAAFAKETYAIFGLVFALGWWSVDPGESRRTSGLWIGAAFVPALFAPTVSRLWLGEGWAWPWQIAAGLESSSSFLSELSLAVQDRVFVYAFAGLIPIAIWKLVRFPRPWLVASMATAFVALLLGGYHHAGGNIVRPIFSALGPLLCLSGGWWLFTWAGKEPQAE